MPHYVQPMGSTSAFANWLDAKRRASASTTRGHIGDPFKSTQDLPPVYEDALDFTAFALDQFRERANRDGAALVILSAHYIGTRGAPGFDRLTALAEPRGIPIIDYNDYVLRQGAKPWRDATWAHDYGGNAALAFGGRCITERVLPDYPIVRIRTGQFTLDDGQLWMAEFPVGAVRGEAAARSAPGRAPGR